MGPARAISDGGAGGHSAGNSHFVTKVTLLPRGRKDHWSQKGSPAMTERTTTSLRTTCSRCGTYSSGSAWCPTCGLNLRVSTAAAVDDESRPAPEALYSRPGPAAPPPERRRPGSLVVLVAVAVAVLVASVLLTVLLTRGGGSTPARGSTPPRASTVA